MNQSSDFINLLKAKSVPGYEHFVQVTAMPNESACAIGFFLYQKRTNRWRHIDSFLFYGIIAIDSNIPNVGHSYYIDIDFYLDTQIAVLVDNVVDHSLRNKGIGSLGLNYVKAFLQTLGCKQLQGTKHPIPNTQEAMDKLTNFYAKNGFLNMANNEILFYFDDK